MKFSTSKAIFASLFFLPALFFSCKKEAASTNSSVLKVSSDEISESDAPGIYRTTSGNIKLVLQPGNQKGQDAWIEYSPDDSSYATHNSGFIDQFKVLAWTDLGRLIFSRSLIKFTDLAQIPNNSSVKQATLFLYGLDEGSVHLPQGNSYYPGSPYKNFGPNDVFIRRIITNWNESSVTWNTRPSTTLAGESLISPSTKQWNDNTSSDVTQMVNTFVQNPVRNYGFMLQLDKEKIYNSYGFYSSESIDPSKRPKLVIVYSN